MSLYDLPHDEYVASLEQNTSPATPERVRSMGFEGYIRQVNFRLEELGVIERPTDDQYIAGWANQVCAKKLAATFKRRR